MKKLRMCCLSPERFVCFELLSTEVYFVQSALLISPTGMPNVGTDT
jgi:hypothetical protein